MTTKKNSDSIGLASYLSPSDLRHAVRLTQKIKSAKRIEDVLRYQKQLTFLMAKAERNKEHRERMIRRQAMELKKQNKEQIRERIKERYFSAPGKAVDFEMIDKKTGNGMVVEAKTLETAIEKAVEKASETVTGTVTLHYPHTAVKVSPVEKKIPRHYNLRSPKGKECN